MRIEAYTQVQQVYNKTGAAARSSKTEKAGFADQLQISSLGKGIQAAKQAVEEAPDVREDVVAPLKQAVQSGTYAVDEDSFANHLFQKYNEMR